MIKQYITWQSFWNGRNVATHISDNVNKNWDYEGRAVVVTELPYGNVPTDKRMLAIVEFDDTQYTPEVIDRIWKSMEPWVYEKITPQEAVDLCNEWYTTEVGEEFTLDADGFTIIDNRTIEES